MSNGDLNKALIDAPKKDMGFSPLTLAWVLRELPIDALGYAIKLESQELRKLSEFRDWLVGKLTEVSAP